MRLNGILAVVTQLLEIGQRYVTELSYQIALVKFYKKTNAGLFTRHFVL